MGTFWRRLLALGSTAYVLRVRKLTEAERKLLLLLGGGVLLTPSLITGPLAPGSAGHCRTGCKARVIDPHAQPQPELPVDSRIRSDNACSCADVRARLAGGAVTARLRGRRGNSNARSIQRLTRRLGLLLLQRFGDCGLVRCRVEAALSTDASHVGEGAQALSVARARRRNARVRIRLWSRLEHAPPRAGAACIVSCVRRAVAAICRRGAKPAPGSWRAAVARPRRAGRAARSRMGLRDVRLRDRTLRVAARRLSAGGAGRGVQDTLSRRRAGSGGERRYDGRADGPVAPRAAQADPRPWRAAGRARRLALRRSARGEAPPRRGLREGRGGCGGRVVRLGRE